MTDATPLRSAALGSLDGDVRVPSYDRTALRCGIVHLGVGGFHRAHLATYADELCAAGHDGWGISGIGVLGGDAAMADALGAQDGLYSLVVRSADATHVQIIGSIVEYIHAVPARDAAIARIAHEDTQIVSLTITEGGYPVDDLSGEYIDDDPNAGPSSAFGLVADALDVRRRSHGRPLTILSCDNIMSNGAVTRTATMGEAARLGRDLIDWIDASVSFPNSMVDRITPATVASDGEWLRTTHGIDDRWPVVTEPFRQWVVEDDFAGERPPLEALDVVVTDDVEPYEFMKLRLLNAAHSCMAYLSALMGIETVDAAMAQPDVESYLRRFLDDESKPVLPPVAGIDVDDYIGVLLDRFANPAIGDQISRLCLDGTAKFPKFLMPTVRAQLAAGGPVDLAALALAGWCQYLLGKADDGSSIELAGDPGLDTAVHAAQASVADPAAFLDLDLVFDADVATDDRFRSAFVDALAGLRSDGAAAALALAARGQDEATQLD